MSFKLTDAQLVVMSAAAQRKDRCLSAPTTIKGAAIIEAAARLFLERGFGSVSMDDLAKAAGVARRTLYNQFASKEEIFRQVLLIVSRLFEDALPPGIETQGDVEEVLRLVA
jgi:TetR/AcrR family transcriptional regulator of autoinduction and epiphytic fitness